MTELWNAFQDISGASMAISKPKISKSAGIGALPNRQISKDDHTNHLLFLAQDLEFLEPGYQFNVIPLIRKIKDANPDVSQAFKDVIQLANTGHELIFDPGVKPEIQLEMRKAVLEAAQTWCEGTAGLHGIINRMFSQLLVAGAIANEWVPTTKLDGIERVKFIRPESIRYAKTKGSHKLQPYQKIENSIIPVRKTLTKGQYVKLNPATFRYYAHLGDAEIPYGTPPYLPAITGISTQSRMLKNIDDIISLMGILGWAEAKMEKPLQEDGESDKAYLSRLDALLTKLKSRVKEGVRDGVSVGFIDDHEFEFKQTVTSADGVDSLFAHNEQQIASALDFDPAFMGRSYNTSETMITILFIKMISQLTNLQNIVEYNLAYGISLFLQLRGYKFDWLKVEFKKSTITDELKFQQGQEIKARVALQNYLMGTIDHFGYAREMGYEKPIGTPIVKPEILAGKGGASNDDEKNKEAKSEREGRQKKKEGPIRKTKPITQN